jgi:hypothetical protein
MTILKLARPVQSKRQLRKYIAKNSLDKREIKMFNNISNNFAAAVAAIFSAAVFVGASVGPAVGNAASVIA